MRFLGLDIGTTGCKLTLFDETGAQLAKSYCDYPVSRKVGTHEVDAKAILEQAEKLEIINKNIDGDKEVSFKAIYFDIDTELLLERIINRQSCPKCGEILEYTKVYMNHRGEYSCKCGFKRNKPDITINKLETVQNKWKIQIDGDIYNYNIKKNIKFFSI